MKMMSCGMEILTPPKIRKASFLTKDGKDCCAEPICATKRYSIKSETPMAVISVVMRAYLRTGR